MPLITQTLALYIAAAMAEIVGCFAFWSWVRSGHSALWLVPGMLSLATFAWLLTMAPSEHAGRAFAAYGGIYIVTSIAWMWIAEGQRPDSWDVFGGLVAVAGAAIILFGPRG